MGDHKAQLRKGQSKPATMATARKKQWGVPYFSIWLRMPFTCCHASCLMGYVVVGYSGWRRRGDLASRWWWEESKTTWALWAGFIPLFALLEPEKRQHLKQCLHSYHWILTPWSLHYQWLNRWSNMLKKCSTLFFCLFDYIFLFHHYKSKYCAYTVVHMGGTLENDDWMDSSTLLLWISGYT